MKKSQITGQIFIYIMVIVVIGLIAIVGYIYGGKIIKAKCNTEQVSFVNTIEEQAQKFDGYNEIQTRQLNVPCNTNTVCLVDSEVIKSGVTLDIDDPVIKNSVKIGVEQNIFLVGEETDSVGYSEKIRVRGSPENAYVCLNRTGTKLNIRWLGDSDFSFVETY